MKLEQKVSHFFKNITPVQWRVIVVTLIILALISLFSDTIRRYITPQIVRDWVLGFGVWAPVMFIAAMALAAFTPFPDSVLTFSSGIIFGPFFGTLLSLTGSLIGNTFSFYFADWVGKEYLSKKFPTAYKTIEAFADNIGWRGIFILRLIPTPIPIDWISYSGGISKMKYIPFITATACGILPGQATTVLLGSSLTSNSLTSFLVTLIPVAILLITLYFMSKKYTLSQILSSKPSNAK
jgi:uncharacterized membrane protein YdjX (TVP38/TMEM64 family)